MLLTVKKTDLGKGKVSIHNVNGSISDEETARALLKKSISPIAHYDFDKKKPLPFFEAVEYFARKLSETNRKLDNYSYRINTACKYPGSLMRRCFIEEFEGTNRTGKYPSLFTENSTLDAIILPSEIEYIRKDEVDGFSSYSSFDDKQPMDLRKFKDDVLFPQLERVLKEEFGVSIEREKATEEPATSGGWFSGWFY